jgi:hypothetical protein
MEHGATSDELIEDGRWDIEDGNQKVSVGRELRC